MIHDREKCSSAIRPGAAAACVLAIAAMTACSSSSSNNADAGMTSSSSGGSGACNQDNCTAYTAGGCGLTTDAAIDSAVPSCAMPGMPTPGPVDDHCASGGDDGGALVQTVAASSCCATSAGDGGDESCGYGPTMYGMEGDDDDCRYHGDVDVDADLRGQPGASVRREGVLQDEDGRQRSAAAAHRGQSGDGESSRRRPVTGTPRPGRRQLHAPRPDQRSRQSPRRGALRGPTPATWPSISRAYGPCAFHFNEECVDVLPDSPHGHAAFSRKCELN